MPAKPNILPKPCPKCGKKNGTIQLAIVKNRLLIRIGHYDSSSRKHALRKTKTWGRSTAEDKKHPFDITRQFTPDENKKIVKNAERKWCSFKTRLLFCESVEDTYIKLHRASIRNPRSPPKTIKLTENMKGDLRNVVMRYGWAMRT